MEIVPFKIRKLALDTARLRVKTRPANEQHSSDGDFPGYFVVSTAPPNVEEAKLSLDSEIAEAKDGIKAIAHDLHRIQNDKNISEPAELVVVVHGYNTEEEGIRAWYSDIYRYISQDDQHIRHRKNLVFVGYRWSSERLSLRPRHLWKNLIALPYAPKVILGIGLACIGLRWAWALYHKPLNWLHGWENLLAEGLFSVGIALTIMVLTLLILRLSLYFRDVYRAINFGVPDLTELLRQIDQAVIDLRVEDIYNQGESPGPSPDEAIRQAQTLHPESSQKIQLNFLGHSMGALVITDVVRILSDVFDRRSLTRKPTPEIGHTLSLSRLILASPDIPVLSIISSRANGLASSLRRFNEAYLFSNEGDLALRLASTAANYISFPSASQLHGHLLGSIALTNKIHDKGIINLGALRKYYSSKPEQHLGKEIATDPDDILNCLFITHSSGKGKGYISLGKLFDREHQTKAPATLADLFTFFDCTDYKDYKLKLKANGGRECSKQKTGLLTRAKGKRNLALWDYIELGFDSIFGRRDVHGGYFNGKYSRQLIYRLAFLGGGAGLTAVGQEMSDGPVNMEKALDEFDKRCRAKGIQVYLSPLRYRVDVQRTADIDKAKSQML
ncbi:MAG: alpha/beta hydrolase, partial [Phormidesmis sp.]